MNYWLMKSEPDVFGIDDLRARPNQIEPWDGVRNYQARNMMRDEMKIGDRIFFYHSNAQPSGIVGTMTVAREGYPDLTAQNPESDYFDPKANTENPRWFQIDVKFEQKFARLIPLSELKEICELDGMLLLAKGSRLSITPVSKTHWDIILELVGSR